MVKEQGRAAVLTEVSLILAAVFWGLNYAATKFAAASIAPPLVVAFRFTVGGLLLLAVLRLLEPESRLRRGDVLPMLGLGCFGVAVAQTAFTFGVSMTSASNTGLVFATAPVWGLLLGFALGLERPTLRGVLGVGLSILGIAVVFYEGLGSAGGSLTGDLLVLVAAVSIGFYTVFSMSALERHTPLSVAAYPTVFAAPVVLLVSAPYLADVEPGSIGVGVWGALIFAAVLATAFTFVAWQRGISRLGTNRVLVYQYLITLTGVASGIIFFNENLGLSKILGGVVILIGVYLARRQ